MIRGTTAQFEFNMPCRYSDLEFVKIKEELSKTLDDLL